MSSTNDADPATGARGGRRPLPWWFWLLFALATLGFVAAPLVSARVSSTAGTWAVLNPSILVYLLVELFARRFRGAGLWAAGPGDDPTRRAATVFAVVAGVGTVLVTVLVRTGAVAGAVVAVLVAAALILATMVSQQRGNPPTPG